MCRLKSDYVRLNQSYSGALVLGIGCSWVQWAEWCRKSGTLCNLPWQICTWRSHQHLRLTNHPMACCQTSGLPQFLIPCAHDKHDKLIFIRDVDTFQNLQSTMQLSGLGLWTTWRAARRWLQMGHVFLIYHLYNEIFAGLFVTEYLWAISIAFCGDF